MNLWPHVLDNANHLNPVGHVEDHDQHGADWLVGLNINHV